MANEQAPVYATPPAGAAFADTFLQLLKKQKEDELNAQLEEQQKRQTLAAGQQKMNLTAADALKKEQDDKEFDAALDASGMPKEKIALIKAAKKANGGISIPWELITPRPQPQPNSEFVGPNGESVIWDGARGGWNDQAGNPMPPGSVKRATPAGSATAEADMEYQALLKKRALKQPLTPEEQATIKAYEGRKTLGPATTFAMNAPVRAEAADQKDLARLDKSYTQATAQIDSTRKPIFDRLTRFHNLVETVNQSTPQADALIAPELLTVMAGGQGSGLRMNEAEIARIVGGRSNWESLKAAVNKWELDPSKALSVTPSQRQQIRALIATVGDRTQAQLDILDDAAQQLVDASTVAEHRQIMAATRKKLDSVMTGPGGDAGAGGALPPASAFAGQPPGDYHAKDSTGRTVTVHWDGSKVTAKGG